MRERLDAFFAAWARTTFGHPLLTLGVCLTLVGTLASQIVDVRVDLDAESPIQVTPVLQIDTSPEAFLHDDDPVRVTWDEFRRRFGRDDLIILVIQAPDVLAPEFMEKLARVHRDLEREVPRLQEVRSLVNARQTLGLADELVVGELYDPWPSSPAEFSQRGTRALSNPLYRNFLISADARFAAVLIETDVFAYDDSDDILSGFDDDGFAASEAEAPGALAEPRYLSGAENLEIVEAVHAVVARYNAPGFEIHVAGAPLLLSELANTLVADMRIFTGLAIATIAFFLGLLFRRAAGVFLPLLVVVCSLLSTVGFMAAAGFTVAIPTQILPSFLLAVGVADSVHVLSHFFRRLDTGESREEAIVGALGHCGLPILLTSLTTAGGLVSFSVAEVAPIADLGVLAPLGTLIAFALSVTLLPALVAIVPIRERTASETRGMRLRGFIVGCGRFGVDHANGVAAVGAAMLVLGALGASFTKFGHDALGWFPEDHRFRVASELINDEMGGSMFMELLVDTGVENGLHDPGLLRKLEEASDLALAPRVSEVHVTKSVSIVDVTKEIHQALNENRAEFYALPDRRELIAQELLLFENSGSDDLTDFADSQFQIARVTMKVPFVDAAAYQPYLVELERRYDLLFEDAEFALTGLMPVMGRSIYAVVHTMASSYAIALIVITPLIVLLIGNLRLGALAMVPNLLPILMAVEALGWLGITIDAFTLMVGGIAIGLVVDDTIHFMHGFRRNFEQLGDVRAAVDETLATTGLALLSTSLVLTAGFLIFTLSSMHNLTRFGAATAGIIAVAFVADVVLVPALLQLFLGRRRVGNEPTSAENAEAIA